LSDDAMALDTGIHAGMTVLAGFLLIRLFHSRKICIQRNNPTSGV